MVAFMVPAYSCVGLRSPFLSGVQSAYALGGKIQEMSPPSNSVVLLADAHSSANGNANSLAKPKDGSWADSRQMALSTFYTAVRGLWVALKRRHRIVAAQAWILEPHLMHSVWIDNALCARYQPGELLVDVLQELVRYPTRHDQHRNAYLMDRDRIYFGK